MRVQTITLDKEIFETMLKEARINKNELARVLGIQYQNVLSWCSKNSYPIYAIKVLEWIKLGKNYDNKFGNILNVVFDIVEEKIKFLEEHNEKLKKDLKYLEFIKNELLDNLLKTLQ